MKFKDNIYLVSLRYPAFKYECLVKEERSQGNSKKDKKNKRRKGSSENQGAGFINLIIPVSTV
jgi:hypothetical protein